jgi:hypothetical protein
MRTFCGLAAAFLLAVTPGILAQPDNAPTPVPLPIPIAAASTAMPPQDLDALRAVHAREINDLSTFKTAGLQQDAIDPYLTAGGGPAVPARTARRSAAPADTIMRGPSNSLAAVLAAAAAMSAALVKIVPHGQSVSPYSPYLHQRAAAAGGQCASLADCFGFALEERGAAV